MAEGTRSGLVLLNGPPGAGKTTVATAVLDGFGPTGTLAVLEHDAFAQMAGAHLADSTSADGIWGAALEALAAAAKAFLGRGRSVLVVVNYGEARKAELRDLLAPFQARHVLLLPSWSTAQRRLHDRLSAVAPPRFHQLAEHERRAFYDDLHAMANAGEFDEVIDSGCLDPVVAAGRVASLLGLR